MTGKLSYAGLVSAASTSAFLLNFIIKIMQLSTQQKGITTEMYVAAYLLSLGYNVSQPLCQDSRYDLIVDVSGKLLRLQVKTARETSTNSIEFNCRSTTTNTLCNKSRRYSSTEIDYFATYWNNKVYLIPVGECSTVKRLHLEKPKQSNWSFIEDYSAKEVLKKL